MSIKLVVFLEKGFHGEWRHRETLTVFHMTVEPKHIETVYDKEKHN